MRLIDADTIDDVVQDLNENHNGGITRSEYKRITAVLYEMPTIDSVPVVRCGNCAKRGINGKGVPGGCPFGMTDDTCDPNAYCSYGVLSL